MGHSVHLSICPAVEMITPAKVGTYLQSIDFDFMKVTPHHEESAFYEWRIVSLDDQVWTLKHVAYSLASIRQIPFLLNRLNSEALALRTIPRILPPDAKVSAPKIVHFDARHNILITTSGGPRPLFKAYTDPSIDIPALGSRLGVWLSNLHQATTSTPMYNPTAKTFYRFAYQSIARVLTKYRLDASLGERVDREFGSLIEGDDECVCQGDFWPGNLLVSDEGADVVVADWEMARRGTGATDVGQFAGEAYLLDRFNGERGLLSGFLKGYKGERGLDAAWIMWIKRTCVHFGTHLIFWADRVPRGGEDATRECIEFGYKVLRKAVVEDDWEWFSEGPLGNLF